MSIPLFFQEIPADTGEIISLSEETARHVSGVLRMKEGERIWLTSGIGNRADAVIVDAGKKSCSVKIESVSFQPPPPQKITVAVSLLKNASRLEWLVEKLTELGVTGIRLFISSRTEKQQFKRNRLENILKSAMLQSQQLWLPELEGPVTFYDGILQNIDLNQHRFIAHCYEGEKIPLSELLPSLTDNTIIFIGPEGDFTHEEINFALTNHFQPVTLGDTRLRAETAAMVAASVIKSAYWK